MFELFVYNFLFKELDPVVQLVYGAVPSCEFVGHALHGILEHQIRILQGLDAENMKGVNM